MTAVWIYNSTRPGSNEPGVRRCVVSGSHAARRFRRSREHGLVPSIPKTYDLRDKHITTLLTHVVHLQARTIPGTALARSFDVFSATLIDAMPNLVTIRLAGSLYAVAISWQHLWRADDRLKCVDSPMQFRVFCVYVEITRCRTSSTRMHAFRYGQPTIPQAELARRDRRQDVPRYKMSDSHSTN